jgi:hypothetical protein
MSHRIRHDRTTARIGSVAALGIAMMLATAACSSASGDPASAERAVAPSAVATTIEATGTIPPSGVPTFGAALADGSLPFTGSYRLDGDLSGTVSGSGTMSVDAVSNTFTQHETTSTFDGTLVGVGRGTLRFVTTIDATKIGAPTEEKGSVTSGTGDLSGLTGTIVMRFAVSTDGSSHDGTYTVTLTRPA